MCMCMHMYDSICVVNMIKLTFWKKEDNTMFLQICLGKNIYDVFSFLGGGGDGGTKWCNHCLQA